jgi:hypothetical protein
MKALRNVSSQSLIVPKPGGGNMHLFPGRAITLSAEDLLSPQAQQLVKSGLVEIETLGEPAPSQPAGNKRRASEAAPLKPSKPK